MHSESIEFDGLKKGIKKRANNEFKCLINDDSKINTLEQLDKLRCLEWIEDKKHGKKLENKSFESNRYGEKVEERLYDKQNEIKHPETSRYAESTQFKQMESARPETSRYAQEMESKQNRKINMIRPETSRYLETTEFKQTKKQMEMKIPETSRHIEAKEFSQKQAKYLKKNQNNYEAAYDESHKIQKSKIEPKKTQNQQKLQNNYENMQLKTGRFENDLILKNMSKKQLKNNQILDIKSFLQKANTPEFQSFEEIGNFNNRFDSNFSDFKISNKREISDKK